MRGLFQGATDVQLNNIKINHIAGDHIQVFPKGATKEKETLPKDADPTLSSRNRQIESWARNLPSPSKVTPVSKSDPPRENRYPYVVFSIDKDASLRALQRDPRLANSSALRTLINEGPDQKFFGYVYQIGSIEEGAPSNQYQIYCLRRGLPHEATGEGVSPDMCTAVASKDTTEDARHRRPLQPSTTIPWAGCYHSSFDILPVMINDAPEANGSKYGTSTQVELCPFLSEKEVARHGSLIAHDLTTRAKLASNEKRKSKQIGGASTPHNRSADVSPQTVQMPSSARLGSTTQKQSWAVLTAKISYELDEKSKINIGLHGLDPSELIELQSNLVAEVVKLGIRDFKGLVTPEISS